MEIALAIAAAVAVIAALGQVVAWLRRGHQRTVRRPVDDDAAVKTRSGRPRVDAPAPDEMFGKTRGVPAGVQDVVQCSVFAPATCRRGQSVLVQVFAHTAADAETVRELAGEADASASRRGMKTLAEPVDRGSKLTLVLSAPGAEIEDPVQTLKWRGTPEAVQFGVTVPGDCARDQIVATVHITQHSVPFGHIKFVLGVIDATANAAAPERAKANQDFKRYTHAFVSYASGDRDEVLKRVQMLARLSISYFQDLLTLEPGERWERALYRHIDRSDVFFLFWSSRARDSEWVLKEVGYALDRKKGDPTAAPEIVPVIIEGPPVVPPPPELRDLHFNDTFLYFMGR